MRSEELNDGERFATGSAAPLGAALSYDLRIRSVQPVTRLTHFDYFIQQPHAL